MFAVMLQFIELRLAQMLVVTDISFNLIIIRVELNRKEEEQLVQAPLSFVIQVSSQRFPSASEPPQPVVRRTLPTRRRILASTAWAPAAGPSLELGIEV